MVYEILFYDCNVVPFLFFEIFVENWPYHIQYLRSGGQPGMILNILIAAHLMKGNTFHLGWILNF